MAIVPKESLDSSNLQAFRDDLREPHVVFGRCALTGEWGKCVAIDLGDICFSVPDTNTGVEYDPETKEVRFTKHNPVVFNNQLTLSEDGLRRVLEFAASQESPIPALKPVLVYMWRVLFKDGSGMSQFVMNNDEEVEVKYDQSAGIHVKEISIVPRNSGSELPTYHFVKETGEFFKSGEKLDVDYDGVITPDAELIYCRKVVHTWESTAQVSLDREIQNTCTSVLQIVGWKVGGLAAMVENKPTPGCVIGIDERGNWRPYHYKD